jgi:hypothetical protein
MLQAAQHGSPALLGAVGRAFGLAEPERAALANGKIPAWFWVTIGVGLGVVAGIRLHKAMPTKIPEWLAGK